MARKSGKIGPYSKETVDDFVKFTDGHAPSWQDKGNETIQVKVAHFDCVTLSYYATTKNVFFQGRKDAAAREAFLQFASNRPDMKSAGQPQLAGLTQPAASNQQPNQSRTSMPQPPLIQQPRLVASPQHRGCIPRIAQGVPQLIKPVPAEDATPSASSTASASLQQNHTRQSGDAGMPAMGSSLYEGSHEKMGFGKHAGKSFGATFQEDPSYVHWAMQQANPSGSLKRFAEYCRRRKAAEVERRPGQEPTKAGLKRTLSMDELSDSKVKRLRAADAGAHADGSAHYRYYIFFDGSCPNNRTVGAANPAGFGVVVYENVSQLPDSLACRASLQVDSHRKVALAGPVATEKSSPFFIGADTGSNNTGELTGIAEALLWLILFGDGQSAALLLYDSKYAARAIEGQNQIRQNKDLAEFGKFLLHQVRSSGQRVHLEHVKGHSGNAGNEEADRLANSGAGGTYSSSGRFAPNSSKGAKELFQLFREQGSQTQDFYCGCSLPAKQNTCQTGVNKGKVMWRCSKGECGFCSWA